MWTGDSKDRGIGVFASKLRLSMLGWERVGRESFIPLTVNEKLTILAVWTRKADQGKFRYIGQAWQYLQAHGNKLPRKGSIVIGDFNSNACWDKKHQGCGHTVVVRNLSDFGLESVYHIQNNEYQGKETQPTFFMFRKLDKPYHIDYAFASADIIRSVSISIGKAEEWLKVSDHMPVSLEIAPK